jgi:hypothetical protein
MAFRRTQHLGVDSGYQAARETSNAYELVVVDCTAKAFRRLFTWNKSPIVSLAVGPKMDWKR